MIYLPAIGDYSCQDGTCTAECKKGFGDEWSGECDLPIAKSYCSCTIRYDLHANN